ncbi:dTDP-4-dehydrorhamnose 3,5-epimerase family protein, partial [Candidatus Saccharibacteria bacterium]|nr:dTDP-4-dehydrorhamnose 3,5-epimerase family protein [Candidatus Saccharibacteria bacterium]
GLIFFDVTNIGDDRGWFQEKFHKQKLVDAGLPKDFNVIQNNLSYNKPKGAIRGFHAEPWDKYVSVVTGKVFAAYLDLRKGPSYGKVETLEITPTTAAFVPAGVANAFQTLEDDTYYLYSVNKHWSADDYDKYMFVNLADPDVGVTWPIPLDQSTMSDRDKNHPLLKDVTPMEM